MELKAQFFSSLKSGLVLKIAVHQSRIILGFKMGIINQLLCSFSDKVLLRKAAALYM